ncbi:MAG: nitrogen regulation protein NR(I) [Pseudomonadota bacterium]
MVVSAQLSSATHHIWVVDDDESIRWVLERALSKENWAVQSFNNAADVLAAGHGGWPDLLITDVRMPGLDGLDLVSRLADAAPHLPVVVMTAYSDLDTTVGAFDRGAYEYLAKPFDVNDVVATVRKALESPEPERPGDEPATAGVIGDSPAMQQVFRQIGRLSRSHLSVLITGETGTGKELIAAALHRLGPRANGPFVAMNTAAVPSELLESELFGHERGAFTGATQRHLGRFEQADGGTLFLDEIGDMPASLQTRLLRVLAEGQFYRVGGRQLIGVDVRVIAATHQDLAAAVADKLFREDLYHRLNVVQIQVPPLRERNGDIRLLAAHFLKVAAEESGLERKQLAADAVDLLERYQWPGNVRELENLCRSITVMEPAQRITAADLKSRLNPDEADLAVPSADWEQSFSHWFEARLDEGAGSPMATASDQLQRLMIRAALARTRGRREAAARLLGCGRNTLTRRIAALDLDV